MNYDQLWQPNNPRPPSSLPSTTLMFIFYFYIFWGYNVSILLLVPLPSIITVGIIIFVMFAPTRDRHWHCHRCNRRHFCCHLATIVALTGAHDTDTKVENIKDKKQKKGLSFFSFHFILIFLSIMWHITSFEFLYGSSQSACQNQSAIGGQYYPSRSQLT